MAFNPFTRNDYETVSNAPGSGTTTTAAGGTVQLQMASEVNGVDVTLQDGLLFLKYRKI